MVSQSIDTRSLSSPLPMMKARSVMEALLAGQILEIFSSDLGSFRDMNALCRLTGNTLVSSEDQVDGSYRFLIEIN